MRIFERLRSRQLLQDDRAPLAPDAHHRCYDEGDEAIEPGFAAPAAAARETQPSAERV